MRTLNLGILAHVDAGKTSLTERLLFDAGVIDEIGSVDAGNTLTDSLALERQRGITIKSAVASFVVDDVLVNLIDTPGHPDFIAEVERVLAVLDGAVLVISAVEGVQAQTRILMRTLLRLGIPTLIFVNKIDRSGAQDTAVLDRVADRLTPLAVPMGWVDHLGTPAARFAPFGPPDAALAEQTATLAAHPLYFGSAITGAGLAPLTTGLTRLLPASHGDADAEPAGAVFKIERTPAGGKSIFVRVFAGTIRVRDRLRFGDGERPSKITGIGVFENGAVVPRESVTAGQIARLSGPISVRIGDRIGSAPVRGGQLFAPPTLETVVDARHGSDRGALAVALADLAEQDPLIDFRADPIRRELSVSLYGEVQKEVIGATLADAYGIPVTFRTTTTLCIERVSGSGAAVELIGVAPNPFLATVGLRLDPVPVGAGISFALEVELGAMPIAFFRAVEETVRETLDQGVHGWPVPDCRVTMTHCGYWPRQSHAHATFDKSMSSTAGDFRHLTPLVLVTALSRAGTEVCEPVHQFELECPADALSPVLATLDRVGAVPEAPHPRPGAYVIAGTIPAAQVHRLTRELPGLTQGEGVLESEFSHYRPVHGQSPTRSRTDHDPLHRREYLLRVQRRTHV